MLATINTKYLKTALELVSAKTTEVNLEITKDRFSMAYCDGVEFIWVIIPKEEFITYEYKEDISFCISTKTLIAIIKKFNEENLRLEITNSQIKINVSQENRKKEYNMRVKEILEDSDNLIKNCQARVTDQSLDSFGQQIPINPKDLLEMLQDLIFDLDSVLIQVINNQIIIREEEATRGSNKSQMSLLQSFIDRSAKYHRKRFTQTIEPLSKVFTKIDIRFKDNYPLLIKVEENIKIYYFIAPLVDND